MRGRGSQRSGGLGLVLALLATTCGEGRGGGDAGVIQTHSGAAPVALDELWGKSAKLMCERVYVCCTTEERRGWLDELTSAGASFEQCTRDVTALLETLGEPLVNGIAAGRIVYHGETAGQCLAGVTAATCSDFFASAFLFSKQPYCSATFEGKMALGDACSSDHDCVGEASACDGEKNGRPGRCVRVATRGQPCGELACAAGLVCSSEGVCVSEHAPGSGPLCDGI